MDYTIASNTTTVGSGDTAPASGTPGEFTNGDPATSTPATVLPGYQMNALVQEIRKVIAGFGLTPSKSVTSQLFGAISLLGIPTSDTGAVNAYTAAIDASITALHPGMEVSLQNILHTNTGASTFRVNAIGSALPIQSAGGVALQGGELVIGYGARLRLNYGATAWTLVQTTGGPFPVLPGAQTEHAVNLGQFASSLAQPGYQKLPSGFIVQWGVSANTGGTTTVTFPIAFPTAALHISYGSLANALGTAANYYQPAHNSLTTTGFSWGSINNAGAVNTVAATASLTWLATGY